MIFFVIFLDLFTIFQAAEKCGINANIIEDALLRMSMPEVKNILKANMQEALDLGAFGVPLIVVHVDGKREVFFGSDRFHLIAMTIGTYV
jgi:glutathione S-transferase kappa 1